MDIPAAANVLGTMGALCWSVQLIPQIIVNYRRHNATGLQPTMMMLWACAGVPLGVYNIVENFNVALKVQPQILTFLSLVTWIQCFYYEQKWTPLHCLMVVVPVAGLMAAVQAALIVGIRHAQNSNLEWPLILMAVAAASLLAAGVLRHYVDIYMHRTVRGISFVFVGIDALGDVFSLVSVVFEVKLDILGLVIYGSELILWVGVFLCGAYYNLIPWIKSRHDKSATVDRPDDRSAVTSSGIALHPMSSSTSVFRTASADGTVIQRRSEVTESA